MVFDFRHSPFIKVPCNAQTFAQVKSVYSLLLRHHDHNIVRGLVVDQQFTVTVGDYTARGILHFLKESVGIGVFLIIVAHDLQRKKPENIDNHDARRHRSYHILTLLQIVVRHIPSYTLFLVPSHTCQCQNEDDGQQTTAQISVEHIHEVEE